MRRHVLGGLAALTALTFVSSGSQADGGGDVPIPPTHDGSLGARSAFSPGLTLSLPASSRHAAQRHPGCRQAAQPVLRCLAFRGGRRGTGREVVPRLARSALWWRLRIQGQVSQDLLDHLSLQDGRDDVEPASAAVRAWDFSRG